METSKKVIAILIIVAAFVFVPYWTMMGLDSKFKIEPVPVIWVFGLIFWVVCIGLGIFLIYTVHFICDFFLPPIGGKVNYIEVDQKPEPEPDPLPTPSKSFERFRKVKRIKTKT